MLRPVVCVLFPALAIGSCNIGPPTRPTDGTGRKPVQPVLSRPVCAPIDTEVHCTVRWLDGAGSPDVTALADWSVSSAPLQQIDTDIATVVRPGVVAPRRQGIIDIHARYNGQSSSASHSYRVDPRSTPVRLAQYLTGRVAEVGTNFTTTISGALVEVIAPTEEAGKSVITRSGSFSIYHLPMDVPITIRASRAGYIASTKTHPGITDDPRIGAPLNSSLHFELAKAQ